MDAFFFCGTLFYVMFNSLMMSHAAYQVVWMPRRGVLSVQAFWVLACCILPVHAIWWLACDAFGWHTPQKGPREPTILLLQRGWRFALAVSVDLAIVLLGLCKGTNVTSLGDSGGTAWYALSLATLARVGLLAMDAGFILRERITDRPE